MPRSFNSIPRRRAALPVPRLPHPSWGRDGGYLSRHRAAVSAAEFWNRLGL
ncbi:MAG: hypothetical protein J0I69_07690 [Altererythrobacter sp.]|nr:hypothetical protein [Altererythrobacter sp.]